MASERPDSDATQRIPAVAGVAVGALLVAGQRVFGRFLLEAEIGHGGMSVVWRARDDVLNEAVALKFLPIEVARDADAIEELKDETRRARRLTHANIVRIHDFVQDASAGTAAIAMELVEGTTLSQLRRRQPGNVFSEVNLARLVAQICAALDYAHRKAKIVHRDLKPANVLVTADGTAKIADFGIARSLNETQTRVTGASKPGTSGTLVYMSPQQLRGFPPTPADDIYALGATLYELLAGKPPFYTGEVTHQILHETPQPLTARRTGLAPGVAALPPVWAQTVEACLAKDASGRPPSARDVARRLGVHRLPDGAGGSAFPFAQPGGEAKPAVFSSWKARATLVAGLAGAAALVIAAVLFWRRPENKSGGAGPTTTVAPRDQSVPDKGRPRTGGAVWDGKPRTIADLGLALMPISAGTFTMGSENGRADERPLTQVALTRPFWLGKTEVTQKEWHALMGMGNNPSRFKGDDRPVERVSWDEAVAFCRKLTERERAAGRMPEGYTFALPTEAQWEYACRAGTTGDFAAGLDTLGWYSTNSGGQAHPVAQKPANAWGLSDMHGNVAEWCADWYADKLPGGNVRDYTGPAAGSARVFRGGSWSNNAANCRAAYRNWNPSGNRYDNLGFRVALVSSLAK